MRRSALFLLTLHLAAGAALAQSPPSVQTPAPNPGIEIQQGKPIAEQHTAAPVHETLYSFDPQHAEVVWSQNHWQLVIDGKVLKDFGRREIEARQAVRLVHDLHLTQHGVVGTPDPVMEYWLSNGRAPHGLTTGLRPMAINPQELRVEQMNGQWVVRDPGRVLFNFGTHEGEAHDALTILKKYGFTQVGVLGGAGPSMLVMLGRAEVASGAEDVDAPHLVHHSPLHDGPANDPHTPKPSTTSDANPVATPVIAPLRPQGGLRKQTLNAYGHNETVEVFPVGQSFSPQRTAALATQLIDRTPFDWRQVQLKQEGGQYVIAAGSLVLGRFTNDHDARQALTTVQHYRFTERDYVGRPQPFCSYFLCSGEAPRGQFFGAHNEAFHPEHLSVAQVENHWAIVTPEKPLLWFGDRADEARVMLDVIQREQFDRICHIGDDRGLTFFVRSH